MAAKKSSTKKPVSNRTSSRRRPAKSKVSPSNPLVQNISSSLVKFFSIKPGDKLKPILFGAFVFIVLLLAFPFRYLVVPATVNGEPIFSWQYIKALHKTAGTQVLDRLVSEKLVEQEIAKYGIVATEEEVNHQIKQIESQFGTESGSLDSILALQGLSRDDFLKELRLNIALEKLIKNNIKVTEDEVQEELTKNAEIYKELSEVEAATTAAENLRNDKIQQEFPTWFQEVRSKSNIKNFFTQPPFKLPFLN